MKVTVEKVIIEENGDELLHIEKLGFVVKSKGLFDIIDTLGTRYNINFIPKQVNRGEINVSESKDGGK